MDGVDKGILRVYLVRDMVQVQGQGQGWDSEIYPPRTSKYEGREDGGDRNKIGRAWKQRILQTEGLTEAESAMAYIKYKPFWTQISPSPSLPRVQSDKSLFTFHAALKSPGPTPPFHMLTFIIFFNKLSS
ncbi:uncharacterized protein G2W53_030397 [Senna tora]|uniref:Uncharacterized protein n=1 Tax=Senna tora TaxID=362788 RepID=A0A834T5Q3_9FABA|nr:uncharacterized protein G2W53_030397 [Senna tora]